MQLEDGPRIDLNTDTAIAVNYSGNEGRISILRGEAFFDVVKNPEKPFIVESRALTAKALGTHYAVRKASGIFSGEVQAQESRVEVATKRDLIVLQAGDVAALTDNNGLLMRKENAEIEGTVTLIKARA